MQNAACCGNLQAPQSAVPTRCEVAATTVRVGSLVLLIAAGGCTEIQTAGGMAELSAACFTHTIFTFKNLTSILGVLHQVRRSTPSMDSRPSARDLVSAIKPFVEF